MWVDHQETAEGRRQGREGARTRLVLVVGDETSVVGSVRAALTEVGYVVVMASSKVERQQALRRYVFDCLVAEFRLPDLRGDLFYGLARLYQPQLLDRTVLVTRDARDQTALLMRCSRCPVISAPIDTGTLVGLVERMTGAGDDAFGGDR